MAHFIPVSSVKHKNTGITPVNDLSDYSSRVTLPVYGIEVSRLARNFPLVFVKQGESFGLHLLCSLSKQIPNLFITEQGKWLGDYLPAMIRQRPFTVLSDEDNNRILCIDDESPLLVNDGKMLFDDGEPSEFLQQISTFLDALFVNGLATQKAVDLLHRFELIIPWDIQIKQTDDSSVPLTGVFRIDESRLNQLEDDKWLDLKKAAVLPLVYGQLLSMGNLGRMAKLLKQKDLKVSQDTVSTDNLSSFFGEDNDDVLNFDGL